MLVLARLGLQYKLILSQMVRRRGWVGPRSAMLRESPPTRPGSANTIGPAQKQRLKRQRPPAYHSALPQGDLTTREHITMCNLL
jgi:hypothetical protein